MALRELALFAGAGGGILGGLLLGWRTVCAVEIDPYARGVLLARQRDGMLEPFPVWDDVRTFDGKPWRGHVDVISGGFPCQDISCAGHGAGLDGARSGLWSEFARIIREIRPRYALVENSAALAIRGLDVVLADLATMGFDARWGVLGACDAGAPHERERIWIVADAHGRHESTRVGPKQVGAQPILGRDLRSGARGCANPWLAGEGAIAGVDHGMADRVERTRAIGNGQVPAVVALAWETLTQGAP